MKRTSAFFEGAEKKLKPDIDDFYEKRDRYEEAKSYFDEKIEKAKKQIEAFERQRGRLEAPSGEKHILALEQELEALKFADMLASLMETPAGEILVPYSCYNGPAGWYVFKGQRICRKEGIADPLGQDWRDKVAAKKPLFVRADRMNELQDGSIEVHVGSEVTIVPAERVFSKNGCLSSGLGYLLKFRN